jgi:hypothetical protein
MLKCLECGKVFEDDEIAYWQEKRVKIRGIVVYENMQGCPYCRGAYQEEEE